MGKEKMEMMRRQVRSQNQIKDAQMEQVKRKNMEIQRQIQQRQIEQRQPQIQTEQRQMANARIAQTNEHNMRVSGGAKRP
jgi:hypothetical protein